MAQAMKMSEAMIVTGLSRKTLTAKMITGEWEIGEISKTPGGKTQFIIWSHKLAKVMGVPEETIDNQLAEIDREKRYGRYKRTD